MARRGGQIDPGTPFIEERAASMPIHESMRNAPAARNFFVESNGWIQTKAIL
jgi:hypothetical protein